MKMKLSNCNRGFFSFVALLALTLFAVSLSVSDATAKKPLSNAYPLKKWVSTQAADKNYIGKIWSTDQEAFISPEDLTGILATKDFVLLGETHDNADHHALQAWIIRKIRGHDRRPVVIMEMIDADQQETVDKFFANKKNKIGDFGPAVSWEKRGWPEWKIYYPILRAIKAGGQKVIYGNPTKDTIRAIAKKGFDGIEASEAREFTLDKSFPGDLQSDLLKELKVAHCDLVKGRALRPMAKVQQYKDALMANQLLQEGAEAGAVLIAGSGHIRNDRGVPFYVKRRDAYFLLSTVAFIEADEKISDPKKLLPLDPDGKPAVDFAWFTPGAPRPDQCEKMKKHFSKSKPQSKKEEATSKK